MLGTFDVTVRLAPSASSTPPNLSSKANWLADSGLTHLFLLAQRVIEREDDPDRDMFCTHICLAYRALV